MFRNPGRTIVFGGPSLDLVTPPILERLDIRPPVSRGDLSTLAEHPRPRRVLILDGVFGYQLSITPTECRQLLDRGWQVVGAASMGALRAADLWSRGMVGIGDVYTMFRLGHLRSDADVAVVCGGLRGEETTASIVHVRAVLAELERRTLVTERAARIFLAAARREHWTTRTWSGLIDAWAADGLQPWAASAARVIAADPRLHPKKRDGLLAVRTMLGGRWLQSVPGTPEINLVDP